MLAIKQKNSLLTILVSYYGFLQLAHLVTIIRAGIILGTENRITFPALPPYPGWTNQAIYFLIGMSIFDEINIICTFIFIYGYFKNRYWYGRLGLINLTAMMSSAIFFTLGTVPSGAWFVHPVEYLIITILFLPVIVLFFLFINV
jgi:hypothetical protein